MHFQRFYLTCGALFALLLSGCGTTPTPIGQATVVPTERVALKPVVSSSNPATVTLIRDTGLQGVEHVFEFWINGQQIVELEAGEKFALPIEPGSVILEVRMFNVLGKIAPAQVETIFAPGGSYVYRAGIDSTLRLHLTRDVQLSK